MNPIDQRSADFAVAQNIAGSSRAGKAGNIVVVPDENGGVGYRVPTSGRVYSTFNEALADIQSDDIGIRRLITDLNIFNVVKAGEKVDNRFGFSLDKAGSGREIFNRMTDRLGRLGGQERQVLSAAGIDVDEFLRTGQMFQATFSLDDETIFGAKKAAREGAKDKREAAVERARGVLAGTDSERASGIFGQGIQVLDEANAMKVIGFRYASATADGMTHLSSYQANLLAAVAGSGFFNPEMFSKIFGFEDGQFKGVQAGASRDLAKKSLKIAKRFRASHGNRPISLSGDDLNLFLSNALDEIAPMPSGQKSTRRTVGKLSDHILVQDFEFDVMRNWALDDKAAKLNPLRSEAEQVLYRNLKSGEYVDQVIAYFTGTDTKDKRAKMARGELDANLPKNIIQASKRDGSLANFEQVEKMTQEEINEVKDTVRKIIQTKDGGSYIQAYNQQAGFGSDVLMKKLETAFGGKDDKRYKLVKAMMNSADLAKDGADVANVRFFQAQVNFLRKQIQTVEDMLVDPDIPDIEKTTLRASLEEAKRMKRNFENAIAHGGQVTGRISISGLGTAKNIVATSIMEKELEHIAFIINKSSIKKETGIAGVGKAITEFINLSGIVSSYNDNVRVDYAAMAAHGGILGTKEHLEAGRLRADALTKELQDALETNVMSSRIRDILDRTAAAADDELLDGDFSPAARAAVIRSREQAKVIQEYVRAGGKLSENADLVNAMFDIINREIFTYNRKKDEVKMVMANVYRFGVSTETGLLGTQDKRKIAQKLQNQASDLFLEGTNGVVDFKALGPIRIGGEDIKVAEEVVKFRISDHKVLMRGQDVAKYMHALGGFDLDDKVIPIITRFRTKSGVEKLAFDFFRQPTGPEETMFMLPNFDAETVQSLLRRSEMQQILSAMQMDFGTGRGANPYLGLLPDDNVMGKLFGGTDPMELSRNRDNYRSSMRLLSKIMEGDGTINNVINYESVGDGSLARSVEQAILDMLRYGEAKGLTVVNDMSERRARNISRFGTSSLRAYPGQDDVGYTTAGIYKVFDDAGILDLSKGTDSAFEKAMRQARFSDARIADIMSAGDGLDPDEVFDARLNRLGQVLFDEDPDFAEKKVSAVVATAVGINGASTLVAKADSALGQYINTTMVVSSMMDQYQDFLTDLYKKTGQRNYGGDKNFKNIYNILTTYNIGMISQETAIDIAVNQGVSSDVAAGKTYMAYLRSLQSDEYLRFANDAAITESIEKLTNASLDTLNNAITPGIVKQTAFIRGLSESLDLSNDIGLYGFDQNLFYSRMLKNNKESVGDIMLLYAKGLRESQQAMKQVFGKTAQAAAADVTKAQADLIKQMETIGYGIKGAEGAEKKRLVDEGLAFLEREETGFYMSSSSTRAVKYGGVAAFAAAGREIYDKQEASRRASLRAAHRGRERAINAIMRDVSTEAKQAATNIVQEFGDKLQAFKQDRLMDMADVQLEDEINRRNDTFRRLFAEVEKYAEDSRISRFDLFTALDGMLLGENIDLKSVKALPTAEGIRSFSDFQEGMLGAQRLRNVMANIGADFSGVGEQLYQKISSRVASEQGSTFAERLHNFLGIQSGLEPDQIRALTGGLDYSGFDTDIEKRFVQRYLRSALDFDNLETISTVAGGIDGQINEATAVARQFLAQEDRVFRAFAGYADMDDQAEFFADLRKLGEKEIEIEGMDDVTVKRTTYKRITDKISEKEFLDIIRRPAIKKTLYGMAALIGFSFAYQGSKDRTAADMSGPPLLPGGSAYETSPGLSSANIENVPYTGYNSGMSYQVSLHGDQAAINRFRESINDLDYGNYSTTMYNNLPRLGRDLYADAAPDF